MKTEKKVSRSKMGDRSDDGKDGKKHKEKKGKSEEPVANAKKSDVEMVDSEKKKKEKTGPEEKIKETDKKSAKQKDRKDLKKKDKSEDQKGKRRRRLIKHGFKYELDKARGKDDQVSIDWETDDGGFETTADEKKLRIMALESELNDLKRENMNLRNEIAHIKPDLDKKTEIIDKYDKRMDKFKEDFDRYKMRNLKEKSTSLKYASEKLSLNLLEVLDNMDRAIKETRPDDRTEDVISAVKQIRKQMRNALEKEGIKPIETHRKPFNPKYHDAIAKEDDDTLPDSTIIEEFQKGYMYKDKVLRVSRVKVSHTDKIPAVKIEEEKPPQEIKVEKEKKKKELKEKHKDVKKKEKSTHPSVIDRGRSEKKKNDRSKESARKKN